MAISACGMACDICKLQDACGGGCYPGTHEKVPARQEQIKRKLGHTCPILRCAREKNVDYCLRCDDFPCAIHFEKEVVYSKKYLKTYKNYMEKHMDLVKK